MTCMYSFVKLLIVTSLSLFKFLQLILLYVYYFIAVTLVKVMVLQSVCGTTRKYTRSKVEDSWAVSVSCPTQFSV
jgi:hypothetical protein